MTTNAKELREALDEIETAEGNDFWEICMNVIVPAAEEYLALLEAPPRDVGDVLTEAIDKIGMEGGT